MIFPQQHPFYILVNGENQSVEVHGADEKLAKDVARLYSWANVEDAPYRDFSRQKRARHSATTSAEDSQEIHKNGAEANDKPKVDATTEQLAISQIVEIAPTSGVEAEESSLLTNESLESVINPSKVELPAAILTRPRWQVPESGDFRPVIGVYSLAGGVGKTTLCANLGRALSLHGENVLLVDASGSGILPYYFGPDGPKPSVRAFLDSQVDHAPLRVIETSEVTSEWLCGQVKLEMDASYWTIFDLGPASLNLLPQIFAMCSFLIVPLLSDVNSILSIPRIESSIQAMRAKGSEIPSPFYLFNQFDPQDPVDKEARELVLRECGGRLLPLSIRHDVEAARAIALRKTVIDHAPGAEIARATVKLGALLRRAVTVSSTYRTSRRWNEA